ncbi:hypothetical protein GQ457_03G017480 [Hibiscus cannabinus]
MAAIEALLKPSSSFHFDNMLTPILESKRYKEACFTGCPLKEAGTPSASSFQLIEAPFSSTSALLAQLKLNNSEVAETHPVQESVLRSCGQQEGCPTPIHAHAQHVWQPWHALGIWKRPWHKPSMWLAQPAPFPPSFPSQMEVAYNIPRSVTFEETTFRQVTSYHMVLVEGDVSTSVPAPIVDPEVLPQGPITRSKAKQFREALSLICAKLPNSFVIDSALEHRLYIVLHSEM